nr:MAG TPA: hypothetical protein [Caudoviricetes sp.]
MSPQGKQLRVVELLPGGEQITSRPLHVVAYMDDHGEAVAKRATWRQVAEDLRGLLAADEPEEAES